MTLFTTLQQFVPQQQLSELAGRLAASRHPLVKRAFIRSFAKAYNITLEEYERDSLNAYESFNDFFTRELKDDARAIDSTAGGIVSPADGIISQLGQSKITKSCKPKAVTMISVNCWPIALMVIILQMVALQRFILRPVTITAYTCHFRVL